MHDLAALVLRSEDDSVRLMRSEGIRAARLQAIKTDILQNIGQHGLTLDAVAQRQQVSRSYARQLLASEGTTFTDLVLTQRLARAHRMLSDLRFAHHSISKIAYEAGF